MLISTRVYMQDLQNSRVGHITMMTTRMMHQAVPTLPSPIFQLLSDLCIPS